MIKAKKSTKTQLHSNTKINKAIEKTITMSEQDNSSDSSLELCITFKSRQKSKKSPNIVFDTIDLTNELQDTKFKDFKSKQNKTINSSNNLSVINISLGSNESFKSTTSVLSNSNYVNNSNKHLDNLSSSKKSFSKLKYNDINSASIHENKHFEFLNNYATPKHKHVQIDNLTESAKLLDRIYGNEWRLINGVIKDSKKNLSDELFENYEFNSENISKSHHSEIENSLSCEISSITDKYIKKKDIQIEINDTSIILEKFSLSNDVDNLATKQLINIDDSVTMVNNQLQFRSLSHYTNECNNIKLNNIKKKKTSKKHELIKDDICLNQQSKIPMTSSLKAKLSFLSSLSCFTGSMNCDPAAEKYKTKFKKNKDDLVAILFKLFNEKVFDNKLPANMNFKWNARLRSTAGACFNKRSVKINENLDCERISRIELSTKIIDTAERLRDTLIHELCHAACWIFNGVSEGHGSSWKSWANKAMQTFPELPVIKRCHSYDIQTKFTYKCIKCGYSIGRHSKSLNLERKRCGFCYGQFELIVNKINNNPIADNNLPIVYTDPLKEIYNLNDVQKKPNAPKKPSKFALFVKENYGREKQKNPILKHGEIMKLLGSQFATTKILTPDEIFDNLLASKPL